MTSNRTLTGPGSIAGRDGTWYKLDGNPVPRVSNLLDGIRSPELERYQRKQLFAGFEDGLNYQEATERSLRTLEAAGAVGTAIHTLIETGTGARSVSPQILAAGQAIGELFAEHIASELTVVKLTPDGFGLYAGTLDVLAIDRRTGWPAIADWKSGSVGQRPFLRHLLQIAAYAEATHYSAGGELVEFDAGERALVGFIVGLQTDARYQVHRIDLSPMSDLSIRLRESVDALGTLWRLRETYGQGAGTAQSWIGGEENGQS